MRSPGDRKGSPGQPVPQSDEIRHAVSEVPLVKHLEFLVTKGFRQGHLEAGLDPFLELGIGDELGQAIPEFFHNVQVGAEEVVGIETPVGQEGLYKPFVGHGTPRSELPVPQIHEKIDTAETHGKPRFSPHAGNRIL